MARSGRDPARGGCSLGLSFFVFSRFFFCFCFFLKVQCSRVCRRTDALPSAGASVRQRAARWCGFPLCLPSGCTTGAASAILRDGADCRSPWFRFVATLRLRVTLGSPSGNCATCALPVRGGCCCRGGCPASRAAPAPEAILSSLNRSRSTWWTTLCALSPCSTASQV
ncbi:hypothetical protein C8J57DRAFT_1359728 [Mycena rebaudengoi]|nr:hypothetical protein C8J57DRAFT_1359728 [Mycena rebaudengoi]